TADHGALFHAVRPFDPGQGHFTGYRSAAGRSRGGAGAGGGDRDEGRILAARPPQGRRRRAGRLAVLHPARGQARLPAQYAAAPPPGHQATSASPAESEDSNPSELTALHVPGQRPAAMVPPVAFWASEPSSLRHAKVGGVIREATRRGDR